MDGDKQASVDSEMGEFYYHNCQHVDIFLSKNYVKCNLKVAMSKLMHTVGNTATF